MKKYLYCALLAVGTLASPAVRAQKNAATAKDDIEYEAVLDDPYDLNKMWIHLYPMVGDVFLTNVNAGFGMQIQYLHKDKFDFRVQARRAFYKGADLSRSIGERTDEVDNKLTAFMYLEGGFTWHAVDKADNGEAKLIIYTKRYSENKWAATVPEFMMVPAKVRKIVGIRAGALHWQSATNLGDALRQQGLTLTTADGTALRNTLPDADGKERNVRIYSNVNSTAFYLGGSLGRIRNVGVKPKKYDFAANDVIFTGYVDAIYSPFITLDNVKQNGLVYLTAPVGTSPFGFRAGFEGMYNRDFSWSYGLEAGMRPSIAGRSFYITAKVGFALASRLEQRRQAFQKEK